MDRPPTPPRTPPPLWGDHLTTAGEAYAADADAVHAAAAGRGLTVPAACLPGVIANLTLLGRHAAIMDAT